MTVGSGRSQREVRTAPLRGAPDRVLAPEEPTDDHQHHAAPHAVLRQRTARMRMQGEEAVSIVVTLIYIAAAVTVLLILDVYETRP